MKHNELWDIVNEISERAERISDVSKVERMDHLVVVDLWNHRDRLDRMLKQLSEAEWTYVDDGEHPPYHMLGDSGVQVFAMILAGRCSIVTRMCVNPNTHEISTFTEPVSFAVLGHLLAATKDRIRDDLLQSREAFNSIAIWIQMNDFAREMKTDGNS